MRSEFTYRYGLFITLCVFVMSASQVPVQAGWQNTEIYQGNAGIAQPRIWGDQVVWLEGTYGSYAVKAHNLKTGVTQTLASAANNDDLAISGDIVIWKQRHTSYGNPNYVHYYNLKTNATGALVLGVSPDIDGNTLIYSYDTYGNGNGYRLFYRDLQTGANGRVTTGTSNELNGVISGSKVLWGSGNLYGKDINTSQNYSVATTGYNEYSVDIAGNIAVWVDNRAGDNRVYGKNLISGDTFAAMASGRTQEVPHIWGNTVVYSMIEGWNVHAYNIVTGTSELLSPQVSGIYNYNPDVSGDRAVFYQRNYNGGPQNRVVVATYAYLTDQDFGLVPGALPASWVVTGLGTATVEQDPNSGNCYAQLTTGSPVTLSQLLDTPAGSFDLLFDYDFLTTDPLAELTIEMNGIPLGTLTAPSELVGDWTTHSIRVGDASLLGQSDVTLSFTFDAPDSGRQVLIDNVRLLQVVPEPASVALLGLAGVALVCRRR